MIKTSLLLLLDNALDFSADGAVVELSAYRIGEQTVIEVKDSGSGIKEQDLEFIFNPFFSTKTHGTGMGLAMVERIVNEHMGRIEVESKMGVGTTIRLILPGGSSIHLNH
jgi:signal transduction histidine kinase